MVVNVRWGKIKGRAGIRARGRQPRASRAQQAKRPHAENATTDAKATSTAGPKTGRGLTPRPAPTTATAKVKNAGWQPFAVLRINLRYGTPVDLHRGAEFHRVAAVDVWSAVAQTLDSIENFKFQNVSSGAEARFDLDFLSELKHRPPKVRGLMRILGA